jgi:hypothetical protein
MVFVEQSHVFLDEMVGNQDKPLAFELQGLPGVSKTAIDAGTLFFLASEVGAKLFGYIFWVDVRRVDGLVMEVKHTQILLLFGSGVNLNSTTRLLLPLTAGRVFILCIGCRGIVLASIALFWREGDIGGVTRCTICKGILIILSYTASLVRMLTAWFDKL